MLDALAIVKPETLITLASCRFPKRIGVGNQNPRGGRPTTPLEIRHLIREMSLCQPIVGARHGFMASFSSSAIDVGQTTVAKYMARGRRPARPRGGRPSFIIHADGIAFDGLVRGSDNLISTALRVVDTTSRPPENPVGWE